MKKIKLSVLVMVLLAGVLVQGHVHDEHCGYNSETDSGCIYEVIPFDERHPGD